MRKGLAGVGGAGNQTVRSIDGRLRQVITWGHGRRRCARWWVYSATSPGDGLIDRSRAALFITDNKDFHDWLAVRARSRLADRSSAVYLR